MVRVTNSIIALVLLCCMVSCSTNDNFFVGEFRYTESPEQKCADSLINHSSIECIGAQGLIVIDSLLLINTCDANDRLMYIYSTNNLTYISSILNKGKGADEDLMAFWSGQTIVDSTAKIWLYSAVNPTVYQLDITKSLNEHRTVINKSLKRKIKANTWGYVDDTTLYALNWTGPNYELIIYNPNTDVSTVRKILYHDGLDEKDNEIISGYAMYKPDMTYIAVLSPFFDQINFISLENSDCFSVSTALKPMQPQQILSLPRKERNRYYIAGSASDQYLYTVYSNQRWIDEYADNARCEIRIFDWNGNLEKILTFNQFYKSIAVDEKKSILYGLTNEETIDKIDISGIH